MGQVLVAYANGDADTGARVAAAMEGAGLDVVQIAGAPSLKADKARFDAADWVVLVWSRRAAADNGLVREAAGAAARARLALARADGAPAPASLRTRVSAPVARANPGPGAARLARALNTRAARTPDRRKTAMIDTLPAPQSTWKGTVLLAVLLAGVAWAAAYAALGSSPAPALMALLKQAAP